MKVDINATTTNFYYNVGDTETKEIEVKCTMCEIKKIIKWEEQKWPYLSTGTQEETINTFVEELNKAGFMYLIGDKRYYFCYKCFDIITN